MKNPDYKENNSAKSAIKTYLDKRADEDELFAMSYAKPTKNIDECFRYILNVARKRGSAVCMTDEEVFGLAIHYYDEDDIVVPKNVPIPSVRTSAQQPKVELTDQEKAAAREVQERIEKRHKQQKQYTSPSLFDFADL